MDILNSYFSYVETIAKYAQLSLLSVSMGDCYCLCVLLVEE
jgi:hypothetical protein